LQYGSAAVLLIFIGLIAFSGYKLIHINREIDNKQKELAQLGLTLQQQKEEIERHNKIIERQKETVDALIHPNLSLNKEQAQDVEQTVEENVGQANNATQIPPRIYIQIGHEEQRKYAGEVASKLQARGYIAPGVENVHEKAPRISQLRYFRTDETAQSDIKNITEFFRSIGVQLDKPVLVKDAHEVHPRFYEIWFGDDFPPHR
jgi:hypothetical protein